MWLVDEKVPMERRGGDVVTVGQNDGGQGLNEERVRGGERVY